MGSELTIDGKQDGFSQQQLAALGQMGVRNASQGDLAVFFHQVQRTGLDPFARQIYMIERQGKQTIQTGIDGFRLIARRASEHSRETFGEPETLWCGMDGVWRDVWLDPKVPPAAAKVVVQRGQGSFTGVATYREYAGRKRDGGVNSMWASKPAIMLAKCAEALALRKAFPQDLSGLYTADELDSPDVIDVQELQPAQREDAVTPSPSKEDCEHIVSLMQQGGVHDAASAALAFKALVGREITNPVQLTIVEAEQLLSAPELVVSRTKAALEATNA